VLLFLVKNFARRPECLRPFYRIRQRLRAEKDATVGLSASLEDYIEAIFLIVAEKQAARSKEIAQRLRVSRASVTEALRALSRKGLINYAPYEVVTLTVKGRRVAEDVIRRHEALKDFFTKVLVIDEEVAEQGACRIEHAAPPEIIERLIRFMSFIEACPRGGQELIKGFIESCDNGRTEEGCRKCVSRSLKQV
jgi:DtxR family Mn-dependent transcriptional regulator